MRKVIFIGSLLVSSVMASGCLNLTASITDMAADEAFRTDPSKCFNAYDVPVSPSSATTSIFSISTKTAGEEFYLHIFKKPYCAVTNVRYYLVDNKTGEKIDGTESGLANVEWSIVTLNVPNSYKDVSVKIDYDRISYNPIPVEVTCPTDPSDYEVVDALPNEGKSGIFAVPVYDTSKDITKKYKCYEYTTKTSSKSDVSTDNFAIRPEKFDITFNKSSVNAGSSVYATIKALNSSDDITTNYNEKSMDLNIDSKAQYSFEIKNGITKNAQFIFLESGTQNTIITDLHFSDVDSDDTVEFCRIFKGEKAIRVILPSKSWAGTGTGEAENDPKSNNVNVDIKQNTKKDLHFQKMGW